MLRSLQARAAQLERSRPKHGFGTISEHIIHNPLLTLQRLLGHASPSTTMVYLRYVDESDELIQRAFESWSDNERDYASYVLAQIEAQRPCDSDRQPRIVTFPPGGPLKQSRIDPRRYVATRLVAELADAWKECRDRVAITWHSVPPIQRGS